MRAEIIAIRLVLAAMSSAIGALEARERAQAKATTKPPRGRGRPMLGDRPMTMAERAARYRRLRRTADRT